MFCDLWGDVCGDGMCGYYGIDIMVLGGMLVFVVVLGWIVKLF